MEANEAHLRGDDLLVCLSRRDTQRSTARDAATQPIPTLAQGIEANTWRRPGAIECEKLKVIAKSGDFMARGQDMEPFGGERWSGRAQLLVMPKAVGDFVDIEIPAPDDNPRQLKLYATMAPDYGRLSFKVNDQPAQATFDGYAPDVQPAVELNLGTFKPRAGTYVLHVQVTGANSAAIGAKYLFGLDCVQLVKPTEEGAIWA